MLSLPLLFSLPLPPFHSSSATLWAYFPPLATHPSFLSLSLSHFFLPLFLHFFFLFLSHFSSGQTYLSLSIDLYLPVSGISEIHSSFSFSFTTYPFPFPLLTFFPGFPNFSPSPFFLYRTLIITPSLCSLSHIHPLFPLTSPHPLYQSFTPLPFSITSSAPQLSLMPQFNKIALSPLLSLLPPSTL